MMGRRRYWAKKKEEWAVRLLQRNWRGKQGREAFLQKKKKEQLVISGPKGIPWPLSETAC